MMKLTIVFVCLLLFVCDKFSEAQKSKEYGDIKSYPYIEGALAKSNNASDTYSMETVTFPEVRFTFPNKKKKIHIKSIYLEKSSNQ